MDFIARVIHDLTQVHPLHPMLVHFPIALTGAALFFILLALRWRESVLEQVAFADVALASVGTVAAGIAGVMDNAKNYAGQAPNAKVKIVLATILFLLTALTAYFRWRKPEIFNSRARWVYVGAYAISFALALVLAFLGGVILYGF
jgi:uncharacterized membrane protein